jgi:hypothetical protein
MNEFLIESINQRVNQLKNESLNEGMNECVDESLTSSSILYPKLLFQLPPLLQLLDNVKTPNQLPLGIQLGVGWPIAVGFEPFAHLVVFENVKAREGDALGAKELDLVLGFRV